MTVGSSEQRPPSDRLRRYVSWAMRNGKVLWIVAALLAPHTDMALSQVPAHGVAQ